VLVPAEAFSRRLWTTARIRAIVPTTMTLAIHPKTSALLVMDFQTSIVEGFSVDKDALLTRTASVIEAARRASMHVIYVVVSFRPGYPEVSRRNKSFSVLRESGRFVEGSPGTEVHPLLAPAAGDLVVTKHRVSALAGADLEMLLRAHGIETLVLAGIATSGVVLSTVRQAADADYGLVVLSDCCSDRDLEVHRVLVEKVFPRQATVTTAEAVIAALRADPPRQSGD
jgi:nicotinamidase-related amidase